MRWCGRRRRDGCSVPGLQGICLMLHVCSSMCTCLLLHISSTMAGQRAHMRCTPYSIPWPHRRGVPLSTVPVRIRRAEHAGSLPCGNPAAGLPLFMAPMRLSKGHWRGLS